MGDSLAEALAAVKRTTVFTTHTPVPAGNETFDREPRAQLPRALDRATWAASPTRSLALGARQRQLQHDRVLPSASRRSTNGVSRLHGAGLLGDVAAPLAGRRRAAGRLRSRTASTPRAGSGPEMRAFYAQHLDPAWEQHLLEPEVWQKVRDGPRRGALVGAPRAEGAADPLRARARAGAVGAPRPRARRAAAGRGAPRPARPHHRLRAALRHLQARVPASCPTSTGCARSLLRPRAAGAAPLRRQGAPGRPRGAGGHPPAVPRSPTASSAASSSSSRTTTSRSAAMLVQGCDVWLNTPRRPQEASGTSRPEGRRSTAASTSASSTAGGPRATAATTAGRSATAQHRSRTPRAQDRGDAESLYRAARGRGACRASSTGTRPACRRLDRAR